MKKIKYLLFFLFLFLISSEKIDNENQLFFDIGDILEIQFIKHGELSFMKKNFLLKKIDIEIASNDIEKMNGLMYRSFMNENRGMLFILKKKEIQKMNIKNIRIPLDIIYIDESNTIIFIQKYVSPMREIYSVNNLKLKYILEINAGMSDRWGIKKEKTKIYLNKY
ncbi:DUF192 domain-containing protein [Blattabacterium cuenoti]|uniref:DUF192 domain-containing protein n=1 Tax=Blattabacterium cuenoti TaxID=1653831 RepID=UPI00163D194E|nr:DUF192 domain-containing protein [Blattabacterium cuenoti]